MDRVRGPQYSYPFNVGKREGNKVVAMAMAMYSDRPGSDEKPGSANIREEGIQFGPSPVP